MILRTSVPITTPSLRTLATTRLNDAGLRATPARIEVLVALDIAAAPITSADLCGRVDPFGLEPIHVRRCLTDLVKAGLVTTSPDGRAFGSSHPLR